MRTIDRGKMKRQLFDMSLHLSSDNQPGDGLWGRADPEASNAAALPTGRLRSTSLVHQSFRI